MGDFVKAAVFDGSDPANTAGVSPAGNLRVETTAPGAASVTTQNGSMGLASSVIVAADPTRIQIQFQNLDPTNTINIRLEDADATAADQRIDPGATYMFPGGMTYTGAIHGIGSAAVVNYSLLIFKTPPA